MKRIILITVLFLFLGGIISNALAEKQTVRILNNSFGVVYDQGSLAESKSSKDKGNNVIIENCSDRAYIYFENDNCLTKYKVLIGDTIVGQGELDLKNFSQQITIGRTTIKTGCSVNGDLNLYVD